MNIGLGHTYQINDVIQSFLNQLTTTATSTITHTFVSPNLQSNINATSITNAMLVNPSLTLGTTLLTLGTTTTTLSIPIVITSGRPEFLNGNNVQGTNYSAYFGTSNSKSAQLVLWDGLASNQYTQLACRSNVFIVQGNITSISLEKNTSITGTLNVSSGINIPTGRTYKINNVDIVLLSALTTTPTTTITHTFLSPNLESNINALSITDSLITNNTISLSKINTSAYNQVGTSDVLAQFNSNGGLNPTYIENQTGNTITNHLYAPGSSSVTLGSVIPTLVIGEEYVNSGVIRLDSLDANKGYIHQLSNVMFIETTNSVGSTINIGKGTNTNTTIRNLTVTSNIGCNAMTVTNTSTADLLGGLGGVSNFIPIGATPSLVCGTDYVTNGVIRLCSITAGSGTVIQQIFQDTYIDNMTANRSINIGTNLLTTTYISAANGKTVFNGSLEYGGGIQFNNIRKISISPMSHTTSLPFVTTNWLPIGNTASTLVLEANITMRSAYSSVRITVNIPLTNWSATASNAHLTVCRNTSAAGWGVLQTTPLLGNNYGMYHHISGGPLYETIQFTWIDYTALTRGSTYYYSLCGRSNTAIIAGLNIGNNNYSEITLEELY
jgi:hypothetical protein